MSFIVANDGTGAAAGAVWVDKVYVSIDSVWSPSAVTLITEVERLQAVEIGEDYVVNLDMSFPMLSGMVPGLDSFSNVYVYLYTDAEDDIYEYAADNDNNIYRSDAVLVNCPPPVDLVPLTASGVVDTFFSGQPITISWTVQNIGSTTELWDYPFWYDGFFLSRDTIFDSSDIFIEDFTEPGPLDEGETYSDQQTINLPSVAEGNFYLMLVADHQNRNRDGDRANNVFIIPVVSSDPSDPGGGGGTIGIVQTKYPDLRMNTFLAPPQGTSGQPLDVIWEVTNVGEAPTSGEYIDRLYLSTDFVVGNGDPILLTKRRTTPLAVGETYRDTMEAFLPISAVGNYILLMKTDAAETQVEPFAESNNVQFTSLFVERPEPADLVVSSISAPAMAMVNSDLDVSWTVTNQGQNPANGRQKDIVYLSQDSLLDISDIRIGIKDLSANLAPLGSQTRSLTMTATPGVPIGEYYLLVQTDAANNIVESVDTNNVAVAEEKILITVPELPLETVETTTLSDATPLFYRIEIPEALAGETMLVSIEGDSLNGRNELYLSYGETPTRANHDFSHGTALMGEQDLVVPAVQPGTYYLLAYGVNLTGSQQTVDLEAKIIEFQIRSIVSNSGGNTGSVTARLTGAKFSGDMGVELYDETLGSISASTIFFVDPTTIFATFNLSGALIGKYDVVVSKDASSSSLPDGFEILEGDVGSQAGLGNGNNGFYCSIENSGVDNLLSANVIHPANTRLNRVVPITIQFGNGGNIDVPTPGRVLISQAGAPLGMRVDELLENKLSLYLKFGETGGPPGILRPGATGSVTVFTKAIAPLRFLLIN